MKRHLLLLDGNFPHQLKTLKKIDQILDKNFSISTHIRKCLNEIKLKCL